MRLGARRLRHALLDAVSTTLSHHTILHPTSYTLHLDTHDRAPPLHL